MNLPSKLTSSLALAALLATAGPARAGDPVPLGPFGGSPLAAVVDPTDDAVVLASELSLGLVRSTDGGSTFAPFGSGLTGAPRRLVLDPDSSTHVLALVGNRIFESFDFGATWFPLSLAAAGTLVDLALQPGGSVWLAVDSSRVYRSTNAGATWGPAHAASTIGNVVFAAGDPQVAYLSTFDGVERSIDAGASFANPGADTEWSKAVLVVRGNPDTLLSGGIGGLMRKSPDGGVTWNPAGNGIPITSTAFLREDGTTLFAAMLTGIWRSENGGQSWTPQNAGYVGSAPIPSDLAFKSDGAMVLATENGLYRNASSAAAWELVAFPNVDLYDAEIAGPGGLRIATNFRGLFQAADDDALVPGAFNFDLGGNTNDLAVDPTDPTRWISGGRQAFIDSAAIRVHTGNGAATAQPYVANGAGEVRAVAFDPHDASHVLAGVWPAGFGHFGIAESTNGGQSWQGVAGTEGLGIIALAFDPHQAGHVLALGNNGLYLETFDAGAMWDIVPGWPSNGDSVTLAFDPFAPGVIYGASQSTGVFRSDDGGATWDPKGLTAGSRSQFEPHPDAPGVLWFADGLGRVMLTADRGETWSEVFQAPGASSASGIALDPADGDLLVASRGSSAWELPRSAPYLRIGEGTVGDGGFAPRAFAGPGLLGVDAPWTLHVDRLQGGAFTLLFIGLGEAMVPAYGGFFYADTPVAFFGGKFAGGTPGLAGDGSVDYDFVVPDDPFFAGFEVFAQLFCQDTTVLPDNITLSNAWRATIQP